MNLNGSETPSKADESHGAAESVVEALNSFDADSRQVFSYDQIVFPKSPSFK
jgi:hypothetical protein